MRRKMLYLLLLLTQIVMAQSSMDKFVLKPGDLAHQKKQLENRMYYLISTQKSNPLPPMTTRQGIGKLTGHWMGERIEGQLLVKADDALNRESYTWMELDVDANGNFQIELPLARPTWMTFSFNGDMSISGRFIMMPDELTETFLIVEPTKYSWQQNKWSANIYVTEGSFAMLSNVLNHDYDYLFNSVYIRDPKIGASFAEVEKQVADSISGKNKNRNIERVQQAYELFTMNKELEILRELVNIFTYSSTSSTIGLNSEERYKRFKEIEQWQEKNRPQLFEYILSKLQDPKIMYSTEFCSTIEHLAQCYPSLIYPQYVMDEMQLHNFRMQLNHFITITDEEMAKIPPTYRSLLEFDQKEIKRMIAFYAQQKGFTERNDLPQIADTLLKPALIERYKGKVIVFLTWDSEHCDEVIRSMQWLQQRHADDNIAWVNLADISSCSQIAWRNRMPMIKGDHYGLNTSQMYGLKYGLSLPAYHKDKKEKNGDLLDIRIVLPNGEQALEYYLRVSEVDERLNEILKK